MIFFRRVVGNSMYPTLREGQIIIAHTLRNFKVGQIVIAFIDHKEVVKRIESIDNKGRVYLVGDNKDESTDSREFGSVSDRQIEGVLIWPRVKLIQIHKNK